MKDRFGRTIEYLRVSVTEDCNLRCIYCRPDACEAPAGRETSAICEASAGHDTPARRLKKLTPVEFGDIVSALADLGIRKVRVTGGEPLVRPDICEIVARISAVPGIDDLSMTTNGLRLKSLAGKLKAAGLNRVNISLDSLDPEKFTRITRGGRLGDVMSGLYSAMEAGLQPVKINTVLIKGINDDEIEDLMLLARDNPIDVRFIELMPIGSFGVQNACRIVTSDEIIDAHPELSPCEEEEQSQPAKYFRIPGFKGRIGLISPVSHKFCSSCNRIRLTHDGKIRPCLGDCTETSVLEVLRENPGDLVEHLRRAIYEKPEGHGFGVGFASNRCMNAIGG